MSVSACESTEQESAKVGRQNAVAATAVTLKLGARNQSVRVSDQTLLEGGGRKAVALKLTSTSSSPQLEVPLLLDVAGAGGKVAYTNSAGGLESSLQRIAELRGHESAWWVDDQVLTAGPAKAVKVRIGTGRGARPGEIVPSVSATHAQLGEQGGVSTLSGTLVNRSGRATTGAAVFAVALRGGKPVAAGRAVVSSLPAHVRADAPFQIFLVGDPKGAKLELSALASAA